MVINQILKKLINLLKYPRAVTKRLMYFVLHPYVFLKNRLNIAHLKDIPQVNSGKDVSSDLEIDIVVPTIDKDFAVVVPMLKSALEYVKHPIKNVYVISPPSELIQNMCKKEGYIFVDENKLLPITKKDIDYISHGNDRSGWLFQQFLKWGASEVVTADHFLITDSDTVYIRPRVFESAGKYIIPCNDELPHIPYYEMCYKLFGEKIKPFYNFTSHHCLFDKNILAELKAVIEDRTGLPWYEGIMNNIDKSDGAGVSDYETYHQYIYKKYPKKVLLEHWENISLSRSEIDNLDELSEKYKDKYKVISFHSYNK